MSEREQILASLRDYMQTDGLDAYKISGCIDGWGTLHTLETHYKKGRFTREDVVVLIHEARDMFGECEKSLVYTLLKSQFPEAFDKPTQSV